MNSLRQLFHSEDGVTAVEYAVMLALIIVACIGGVTAFGSSANATFTKDNQTINDVLNTSSSGS